MAAGTNIPWATDTWNPWIGCAKVAEECEFCYADALDEQRFSKTLGDATKAAPIRHWGKGALRHLTSQATRMDPVQWNRKPFVCRKCGHTTNYKVDHYDRNNVGVICGLGHDPFERRRIFCGSLMDWADEEVPDSWRDELFSIADQCRELVFMFLTKRPKNAWRYISTRYGSHGPPSHFWGGMSWVRKRHEELDYHLSTHWSTRFLSIEPMLGPVDIAGFLPPRLVRPDFAVSDKGMIDWVIFGGESGSNARPCDVGWIRDGVKQCRAAGVAPFVKQLGSFACQDLSSVIPESDITDENLEPADIAAWEYHRHHAHLHLRDPKGADPSEWPADLRIREFPTAYCSRSSHSSHVFT